MLYCVLAFYLLQEYLLFFSSSRCSSRSRVSFRCAAPVDPVVWASWIYNNWYQSIQIVSQHFACHSSCCMTALRSSRKRKELTEAQKEAPRQRDRLWYQENCRQSLIQVQNLKTQASSQMERRVHGKLICRNSHLIYLPDPPNSTNTSGPDVQLDDLPAQGILTE